MSNFLPLSILVPIYNVERYLAQCLDSLVGQTLQNLEIICINDGSTDSSLAIIKKYQKQDHRIKLIDKPNTGYGDSMNQGLKKAKGKYIGILEPDDWIEPNAFEVLVNTAEEFQADVVKANYYKFSKNSASRTSENTSQNSRQVVSAETYSKLFQFAPAIWSAIYRREFLKEKGIAFLPTPGASYQDLGFAFKVWATASKVVLLQDAFVHYRTDNTDSSVNDPGKMDCVIQEYAGITEFLDQHQLTTTFGAAMEAAKFRNYHWNLQRLSGKLARQFYQTMRQEFLAAKAAGRLDKSEFSHRDWLVLQAILRSPKMAYSALRLRSGAKRKISQLAKM